MQQKYNLTPLEALQLLVDGNKRFTENKPLHPRADVTRCREVAGGQTPFAAIVTCSDSRIPPEIIFDTGIGDLFVVRVAGNIITPVVTGSIVYAVEHLACPLVVVLGHEACGAVTASLGSDDELSGEPAAIRDLIASIRKNIPGALSRLKSGNLDITGAVRENAASAVHHLEREPVIISKTAEGATVVKQAYYSFTDGMVTWV